MHNTHIYENILFSNFRDFITLTNKKNWMKKNLMTSRYRQILWVYFFFPFFFFLPALPPLAFLALFFFAFFSFFLPLSQMSGSDSHSLRSISSYLRLCVQYTYYYFISIELINLNQLLFNPFKEFSIYIYISIHLFGFFFSTNKQSEKSTIKKKMNSIKIERIIQLCGLIQKSINIIPKKKFIEKERIIFF